MIVKVMIKHKCRKVYSEHLNILVTGLPRDLRDLYFEQGKTVYIIFTLFDCCQIYTPQIFQ